VAGVRRGSFASRATSWVCLSILLFLVATISVVFVSLTGRRFA
jgi:hypothetical protein